MIDWRYFALMLPLNALLSMLPRKNSSSEFGYRYFACSQREGVRN
jgi:hypothetical protein